MINLSSAEPQLCCLVKLQMVSHKLSQISGFNYSQEDFLKSLQVQKVEYAVSSIFPFFHNVFNPIKDKFRYSSCIVIVIWKCRHFVPV